MLDVSSNAFKANGQIPSKYTCDGWGISPPLHWSGVPEAAQSVAILVDDPDSADKPFLHWLMTDIPPELHDLDEGAGVPLTAQVGESDAGTASYYGPCPTHGEHHYRFHIYALDTVLGHRPANRDEFLKEIEGHVIEEGELIGVYERPKT